MPEAKSPALTVTLPSDREILMTRTVDAPRELVFKAWTDPKHLAQWWGPKDFTNPVVEMDLRPGGTLRIVMRGPDGTDYPMKCVYHEIVAPERIVYTDSFDDGGAERSSLLTITFEDRGGKTALTLHSVFGSKEDRDAVIAMRMEEGWGQSFERLDAYLPAIS
jgi:uncharacterized protein YndB with AHSA1/START domain